MTMNFRNNFARLASSLLDEGKRDSAIKVLDRCQEIMPDETVPYNVFVLGVAEAYYRAGELKKATAIMERMKQLTEQELDYYLGLDVEYTSMVENETKRSMSIMQELSRLARTYNQTEMSKQIEDKFKIYYEKFVTLFKVQ
jgi:tetratricopeptide (TPR) repeat protein